MKRRGAKDWSTGLEIWLKHRGRQHVIQSHHIFPRARVRDSYDRAEVNEIANRAFIGGRTNRQIYSTPPSEYLPNVIKARGEAALTAQCVPLDPGLWQLENFRAFLDARRRQVIEAVNELVG